MPVDCSSQRICRLFPSVLGKICSVMFLFQRLAHQQLADGIHSCRTVLVKNIDCKRSLLLLFNWIWNDGWPWILAAISMLPFFSLLTWSKISFQFSFIIFFSYGAAAQRGSWPPHSWGFYITHSDAAQSVGLLWTRDQRVAEIYTWRHTTRTADKHTCPRWDSNPQSQQASGRRPTP